ncbi:MAG: hypothetical protein H0T46_17480 [Deltaproteobacteria bacterium]|nr:hypothetical protein [Deltaproteobacteria bacterium]
MIRAALIVLLLAACGDDGATPADAAVDTSTGDAPDAGPSCTCTYGAVMNAGAVTTAGADELSGLVASRMIAGTLWAHNDSGDGPRLFALTTSGSAKGTATLQAAAADDWEDIAVAPCGTKQCIYVADIGDNLMARASVRIYEVDEPAAIQGPVNVTYRAFDIAYPNGARNSEALFVDPRDGESYIITKQATNPSTVYRMPRMAGVQSTAVSVGTINIPGGSLLVTGADLHVDACGLNLLVRTYDGLYELHAPVGATIAQLVAAPKKSVPSATEAQGEAVAYLPDGRSYLTVSEEPGGAAPQLKRVACN